MALESFNADGITPRNFSPVIRIYKKIVIGHVVPLNLPLGFDLTVNGEIQHGENGDYVFIHLDGSKSILSKTDYDRDYSAA